MHFIKNIAEQQQLNIKPLENSVTQQQPSTTHCTTLFLRTPILSTRIRNTDETTPVKTKYQEYECSKDQSIQGS